jgi:type II secretory ATPase GspE/PulE/Tfp pilus assembly ATPase PilB-like protein
MDASSSRIPTAATAYIAQCSINAKINLTFEETLRHIVRQDPDVIVLGEVRDKFFADVAIQAALTGHKVLTTFHTEDSIGCLLRLLNMDIEAFLISSTLVSVVAQRLVRKLCVHCAEPYVREYRCSDDTTGCSHIGRSRRKVTDAAPVAALGRLRDRRQMACRTH